MGEYADMAIADSLAMDDGTYGSWDDLYDGDTWARGGGWLGRRVPQPKTCRSCGATGLHWDHHTTDWRLFTSASELHTCQYKSAIGKKKDDYNDYLDTIPWE